MISKNLENRLNNFKNLKKGWMDGQGEEIKEADIDWLISFLDRYYTEDLPNCFAYPMIDGGVVLEWGDGTQYDISLEINIDKRTAVAYFLNFITDNMTIFEVSFLYNNDWDNFIYLLKKEIKNDKRNKK